MHVLLLSAGKILKTPFGGEDVFTRLLGKWLAKQHQVVTLMGIEFAGLRVRRLTHESEDDLNTNVNTKKSDNKKFRYGYLLYSLRSVFWLLQVFKILSINLKNPINIIHTQDSGYTGLAGVIAGKILHVPVIITLHGIRYKQIELNPYINDSLKKIVLKIEHKLDVFTFRNVSLVTVTNSTLKDYVESLIPESNIVTIPIAIKIKNFEFSEIKRESIRRELGIGNNSKIIGNVGRLSYEKNLFTLLDSFADAAKYEPSLRLVLVGRGPLEYELRKQIRDTHMDDKVIFCGFRNDISNFLSSFDIFLHCSFIESTSTTLLEAMVCGVPIICSDIPANREWITNNKEGLLINPNDREGFRDAIILLLSDETLRHRLALNAKNNASQYDEDVIFPQILKLYQASEGNLNNQLK